MAIELPKTKVPAKSQDPKYLILFGLPKVGKTTVLSTLDNNLILDMEQGTTFIDALKVEIKTLADLKETIKLIKAAGKPYKYITIDTITAVEADTTALQKEQVELLNSYKDVVKHASFGGTQKEPERGGTTPKSFEEALAEFKANKKK